MDQDQQALDLKRQLQVIEQETSVLRNKVQSLETENEKLTAENKKLSLLRGTKAAKSSDKNMDKYIDQIASLEVELADAKTRIKELENTNVTTTNGGSKVCQGIFLIELVKIVPFSLNEP